MVYEYEVNLRFRLDGKVVERMFTQYAYSVQDATMQAILMLTSEETRAEDARVIGIGPPRRLIEAASKDLAERLARMAREFR